MTNDLSAYAHDVRRDDLYVAERDLSKAVGWTRVYDAKAVDRELSRLSRIEDKYVNLCAVLNEQAGEIERLRAIEARYLFMRPGIAECCEPSVNIEEFERRVDASIKGGRPIYVNSALDPPAYQGAVTDSEDVPR